MTKLNRNLESPTVAPWPETLGTPVYDERLTPSLRAIDVLADGVLVVDDIEGNRVTYNLTNVAPVTRIVLQIREVIGDGDGAVGDGVTGTDIALESLIGLH